MIRDDLIWMVWTIYQEAAGESDEGKLAVAWVIMNRYKQHPAPIASIVLAPFQFSCWNSQSPTRRNVEINELSPTWLSCFRAAAAAYFNLLPDPTKGATHYLNPRKVSPLPDWYKKGKILAQIGNHDFLTA